MLERIEKSYGHREQAELSALKLSVEHILPQRMSPEWISGLVDAGEDPEAVDRELIHTFGNLTLSAYKSELSNKPFERKQQIYGDSHLSLNKDLVAQPRWGALRSLPVPPNLQSERSTSGPLLIPGITEEQEGFDWTRMHAAIATIPDGRWTAYSDLAALAGTSAQAVGNHMATDPSLAKAYRVLTADGKVSHSFAWSDPLDTRDPMAVLIDEGVVFDDAGRASSATRSTADDLHALLDSSTLTTI